MWFLVYMKNHISVRLFGFCAEHCCDSSDCPLPIAQAVGGDRHDCTGFSIVGLKVPAPTDYHTVTQQQVLLSRIYKQQSAGVIYTLSGGGF